VLVVEDEPAAVRLAQAALQGAGYPTVVARSGEEALRLAEERWPAAVVLDLGLPGMDGFEFLERLRRLEGGPRLPVIVWTVKDLSGEQAARLAASAQAVVLKSPGGTSSLLAEVALWTAPPAAGGERAGSADG
jgi:CheY-like chemotaxis protein